MGKLICVGTLLILSLVRFRWMEWVKRLALLLEWHMGKPRKFFFFGS